MTEAEWKETSVTNPSYFSMDNYVIQPINQGGWVAKNGFPLADGLHQGRWLSVCL